jgi:hypothetical protein
LFGAFRKAPQGRNVIARGAALGLDVDKMDEALKGRDNIPPFQGLLNKLESIPVALPQANTFRPFRAFREFICF